MTMVATMLALTQEELAESRLFRKESVIEVHLRFCEIASKWGGEEQR